MVKCIYKSLGFGHRGLREEEIARVVVSTCAYAGERVKLKKVRTLPVPRKQAHMRKDTQIYF